MMINFLSIDRLINRSLQLWSNVICVCVCVFVINITDNGCLCRNVMSCICRNSCPKKLLFEWENSSRTATTELFVTGIYRLHCSRAVTIATIILWPAINSLINNKLNVKLEKSSTATVFVGGSNSLSHQWLILSDGVLKHKNHLKAPLVSEV